LNKFCEVKIEHRDTKKDQVVDDKEEAPSAEAKTETKNLIKSIELQSEFTRASDDKWKQICIDNFDFVKISHNSNKDSTMCASKLAKIHDN
jgi:hypothetical protein